jgi:hypothetical protein
MLGNTGPYPAQSGFGALQFSFVLCLEGTLVRTSFPSDEDVKHTTNNHVADAYRTDKPWPLKGTMFKSSILVTPLLYIVSFLY